MEKYMSLIYIYISTNQPTNQQIKKNQQQHIIILKQKKKTIFSYNKHLP
jgi:hypothetical protein